MKDVRVNNLRLITRGLGSSKPSTAGKRTGDGNVAAETRAGHPHARLGKVIVRPVRRPRAAHIAVLCLRRLGLTRFGVMEIEAPQIDPQRDQVSDREKKAQTVPDDPAVDQTEQVAQQPFQ